MFEQLSERLLRTVKQLRGQGRLTDQNIQDALREVRMALLEADVALPVTRDFIAAVREQAVGKDVALSLTPGQMLIKIVHKELIRLMGEANEALDLRAQTPAVILMAGLQGSGKTTSVAKLARWLHERQDKKLKIMAVSCDVYRPAAIDQLRTLAEEVGMTFCPSTPDQTPDTIAQNALDQARRQAFDVLLVDTAGRLHIDQEMMTEITRLHTLLGPVETLFVVDSMAGQDAAQTAKAFHAAIPLTGVILTKTDGDARGGAALSIRHLTGKPIKFIGVGEKTTALEAFHPERMASRILGMDAVLSVVEVLEQKLDRDKAVRLAEKVQKGKAFTLDDFRGQLEQMVGLDGLGQLIERMPGFTTMAGTTKPEEIDREVKRLIAIIQSMTLKERRFPDIIKGSRKRRIAAGSGTKIQDVNRLLKQFDHAQRLMKRMKGLGLNKLMRSIQHELPPGFLHR